jgi:penicillin-binding protein 2
MKKQNNMPKRYTILLSAFALVCFVFVARIANLQFDKSLTEHLRIQSEYTTETKVIQALRGNICDRNGKVLVTTSYAYDIILDYNSMPDDFVEFNSSILALLDALSETQNNEYRANDLFPFVGEYPNYSYSEEALTKGTATYNALNKMLKELELENISAQKLTEYFVKRWKFNRLDANSNPIFSDEEIGKLIRIRYDMLRCQFSAANPYTVAKGVDISFLSYVKELAIVGVSDKISSQRTYMYPGYASHILGRVGAITSETWDYYKSLGYGINDVVGIDGCENEFEEYLRGRDGLLTITRNGDGEIVKEEVTVEPIAGKDVYLTIDIDVQIAAEDALKNYMETYNKNSGASIAIDPNTGDVLAIASYPTYNLATFSADYNSIASNTNLPLLNRAIGATYAPGSTYKVAVALAALEEGIITESTCFACNHGYKKHNLSIACNNHNNYHTNKLNVIEALTFSCNAFFIEAGLDNLDIDKMAEYCKALGLGQSTGIELGEKIGQIAHPDNASDWILYEEASSYIGQSIHKYTPLQVTSYIATVANGGTRYAAHLLHSVKTFSGEVVYSYTPTVLSSINISQSTLNTIKNSMKSMVDNSTTVSLNMYQKYKIDVTVCGKSGTAQIGNNKQNCWFTAFAPMENPQIAVTSIIEEGSSGASVSDIDAAVIAAYLNSKK